MVYEVILFEIAGRKIIIRDYELKTFCEPIYSPAVSVFLYRLFGPLHIFVVSPEFERPLEIGAIPEGLESVSAEVCVSERGDR